jgi:hypothetical protein
MTTHSPGPWLYHIGRNSNHAAIVDIEGTHIVELSTLENSTAHSDLNANAQLIAAAPDLLHAVEICRSWIAQYHNQPGHDAASRHITNFLDDVISTATGENK